MRLRWNALLERLRSSLFFVPMLAVVSAAGLALLGLTVDSRIDADRDLPLGLTSTVESARTLLGTVAAATITFAAIAFSVSVLVVQQASNQHSPRVVHTLFRDPFNKRVMALVMGTFTFCLLVLRSVRSPLESGDDPVIPNLSVAVAVLLGIATILAVVAFINHSAHAMDISEILDRARKEAIAHIGSEWSTERTAPADVTPLEPDDVTAVVRFDRAGWVQQVDAEALLACVPDGAVLQLNTYPGRYAVPGTVLCELSAPLPDGEAAEAGIRRAVSIGTTRTMQQDPSYGIRELVDVALRALSPGVNDPTTAQDAVFHTAAVLVELLRRDPPPSTRTGPNGARLVLAEQHTHRQLVGLAFDEVRRAAAPHPTVCIYLLEALALLQEAVAVDRPEHLPVLAAQARLVVAGCEAADVLPQDLDAVRQAYRKRFTPDQ